MSRTIRELETTPNITTKRSSIFHTFSSASTVNFTLDSSPKTVTIANTSASVIPIITVKTKNTAGDAFFILANTPIPVGATLVLDSEALASRPGLLTIVVAVLTGTPAVQAIINI
tara:strand:+ start:156 stop:500 length:345 start_codon:yes stop_codon:yes gene_type:complete